MLIRNNSTDLFTSMILRQSFLAIFFQKKLQIDLIPHSGSKFNTLKTFSQLNFFRNPTSIFQLPVRFPMIFSVKISLMKLILLYYPALNYRKVWILNRNSEVRNMLDPCNEYVLISWSKSACGISVKRILGSADPSTIRRFCAEISNPFWRHCSSVQWSAYLKSIELLSKKNSILGDLSKKANKEFFFFGFYIQINKCCELEKI